MLLENKVAVIYGAGGPLGGAVARAFAREEARVFLASRTKAKLDKVADGIRSKGGVAETAILDALDERLVNEYIDAVVEQAGYRPCTRRDHCRDSESYFAEPSSDPGRCGQRGSFRCFRSSPHTDRYRS